MIGVAANNQDFDLLIVEDLSDSSWSDFSGSNRPSKSMSNQKDRPYLNSGRRKSPGPASFRDVSDREAELVNFLITTLVLKLKVIQFFIVVVIFPSGNQTKSKRCSISL